MGFFGDLFRDPANPNRSLEKLMAELAQASDPALRQGFFREMLESSLRLASPSVPEQGRLPFLSSKDASGGLIMLAFTGKEALLNWRKGGYETVELETPKLCALALEWRVDAIAINPCGPGSRMLQAGEIRALAERRLPDY